MIIKSLFLLFHRVLRLENQETRLDPQAPVPGDEEIPRQSIVRLFSKAQEPKKLIWLQSGHIRPSDRELTKQIVEILLKELSPLLAP